MRHRVPLAFFRRNARRKEVRERCQIEEEKELYGFPFSFFKRHVSFEIWISYPRRTARPRRRRRHPCRTLERFATKFVIVLRAVYAAALMSACAKNWFEATKKNNVIGNWWRRIDNEDAKVSNLMTNKNNNERRSLK